MPDSNADAFRFQQIVLPHVDAAHNLAHYLTHDSADAADVVQEALLRAWRYFGSFHGGAVLPWLLQIVRHAAYDLRDRRHTQALEDDLPVADTSSTDPAAEMIARADADFLRQAVEALPTVYREVIILRELEGLSYKEIAAATGAGMGTVMSRLTRARRHLQAEILRHEGKEARRDL